MAPMANKDEIRYQKPPCRMLPKEKSPPLREGGTGWPKGGEVVYRRVIG